VPLTETQRAHFCDKGFGELAGGAAFRLSGGEHARLFTGDSEWTEFVHPFQIHDPRDIELVAEIRAHAGETWFDLKSMQLKMVP
jgi:hypothetical protein